MDRRTITDDLLRDVPVLDRDALVSEAVATIRDAGLPALPVVDHKARFWGIFGEREFIGAAFPAYLGQLRSTGFVPHSLDTGLKRRAGALTEPIGIHASRDRVAVGEGYSDTQLAEIFLHYRVLIVPVVSARGIVRGVITRRDFFDALALRLSQEQPTG